MKDIKGRLESRTQKALEAINSIGKLSEKSSELSDIDITKVKNALRDATEKAIDALLTSRDAIDFKLSDEDDS